ncbi:ThuA domain-containing protein [Sphaerisporangium sp. NPDC051017]|uniref:ThuA domain-containing protein n=1 Tax=Sphaerisporangium sp. NPDC051017 TaxID=3154636 RepID=UPI0034169EDB
MPPRRLTARTSRWIAQICALLIPLSGLTVLAAPAQAAAVDPADYQRVEMAKGAADMGEPMSLSVLPDLSVLHTSRDGTLRRTDARGDTTMVGVLNVYSHDEEGLQGVAADPGFATNRFIYLYYAPRLNTPSGDAPLTATDFSAWKGVNRLSRFTVKPDWTLDMSSEVKVLDVAADRGICCHVGGDMDFDAAGNLYLSTGDDSNPFDSAGYSPLDERTDRNPSYDAQRSSANTNDLRGKLLRIKVKPDGTYDIPQGNLFPPGTANTRPEIYAMGFRNPFRLTVDKPTGIVYVGDYGPDSNSSDPNRGPSGQVEFNRVTGPGNYGWPYCTGTNTPAETYNRFTFPSGPSGPKYDCAGGPTNDSFRNTGLRRLPPAQPAWIRYGGDAGSPPEFGGGSESPMAGPVYHYDAALKSAVKFPQDLDGQFFAAEFGRKWIKPIAVNSDGTPGAIGNFPWTGTQIMDLAFGPDGALYVLDYGSGYFGGDANSALYRYEYIKGRDRSPIAAAKADKTSGKIPLTVTFSSAGSADPEGAALTYAWDFGDGTTSTEPNPVKTYTTQGRYSAKLTVSDPAGNTGTASVVINAGNTAPTVALETPGNGELFQWGDTVPFTIKVTDAEDGAIDCAKVTLTYVLGHDSHGHQITSKNGCSGALTIPLDGEHDEAANIFAVFDAEYTDKGGLTTHAQHILQPRHRQAEHYSTSFGVNPIGKAAAHGGRTVGDINNGDWIAFKPYDLTGARGITARVSSGGKGGTILVRADSATGPVLGKLSVPVTASWETFVDVSAPLSIAPAGMTQLYLYFKGNDGALFDVDDFTLTAAPPSGGPVIGPITSTGGQCLDISNANPANGTNVQLYTCNDTGAQVWSVNGSTIRSLNKCLDVDGGRTADNTRVQIWDCVAGVGAQVWTIGEDGTLKNPQSGKCLDGSNAGQMVIKTCDGSAAQKWTMPSSGTGGAEVLVFSRTAGFRHDSIPAGIQAIKDLGFKVTATEDPGAFTAANLAKYKAVVFLSTTGDVLNDAQQAAFESYIKAGGGYAGVHAAADTEYDWPFYGGLVGAWFASHPAIQPATVKVEDRAHAATAHLGPTWNRSDEWYDFRTNARTTAHVLATLDESSYSGGGMGKDHPIAWCKTYQGGRSFYTGGGHTAASFAEPEFRRHLLGGISYAVGDVKADCRPETGYTTIYNGSTTGWSQAGPGGFTNADGTLTSQGGLGMLWYKAKEYNSYSLKMDWKMRGDDNSGVFVGFPASDDPWSAVNNGYEIQIDATDAPEKTTGAVYGFKSADLAARDAALNPPGQWNTYEIRVEGERLQVILNGVKINDFTNTDPVRSLQQGYIGIQNHGDGDEVAFRNIRIKELGATTGDVTVQAEAWTDANGVQPYWHTPAHGGTVLGFVNPGDWAAYDDVDLTGVIGFTARVASPTPSGGFEIRTGSPSGPVLGTITVPNTGGWETYADVYTPLTNVPSGSAKLYLVFTGSDFDVDDFTLVRVPKDTKAPVTKAALDPAERPTGWYTAPVTVTLSATDEESGVDSTEYKVDAGQWTAYTRPFTVGGDGTQTVSFRSKDKAGNQEDAKNVTLKLDATKPVLTIGGLNADGKYGDSAQITVNADGKDTGSGIDTVTATLDGGQLRLGTALDLTSVALGTHTLKVTAKDKAGNTTEQTRSLTVTTSFGDLTTLFDRFDVQGPLGSQLRNFLESARKSAEKGHTDQALHHLGKFRSRATGVADPAARAVLVRDADALIVRLGGEASAEGIAANSGDILPDMAN